MTEKKEELKEKVEKTTDQPAPAEEKNDKDSKTEADGLKNTEEPEEEPNESDEIDYKSELERVQSERENYKQGMLNAKSKLKEKKEKSPDEPALDEERLVNLVNKAVDQRTEQLILDRDDDKVDAEIASLTDNPDERDLIKFHYKNSVNRSGTSLTAIREDLENAQLIANKKLLKKENRELKEALKSRATVGNSGYGSSHRRVEEKVDPRLSDEDLALLKRHKIDPKTVKLD